MSAVGSLSAGVAHEFNNLLLIMKGNIDLCPSLKDNAELIALRTVLLDLIDRGGKIVNSLLNFSRGDKTTRFKEVDVIQVIKDTLLLMQRELSVQHIGVHTNFGTVPMINGLPDQLAQVFINIIRNAIEAMSVVERRKITITVSLCDNLEGLCKMDPAKACNHTGVKIAIADTGPGIAENIKDKIFEPFVTTKGILGGGNDVSPGTGLGLSIAYGIIKRHDGYISGESVKGQGATFTVYLHAAEKTVGAKVP
jgi:signal transduction histidine kinase